MKSDNELIAEFMGFKFLYERGHRIYQVPEGQDLKFRAFKLAHVKFAYDTSWDWLMPVVEKIESIPDQKYVFTIFNCEVWLSNERYRDTAGANGSIRFAKKEATKIESVYKACVEFIKWHNNSLT